MELRELIRIIFEQYECLLLDNNKIFKKVKQVIGERELFVVSTFNKSTLTQMHQESIQGEVEIINFVAASLLEYNLSAVDSQGSATCVEEQNNSFEWCN